MKDTQKTETPETVGKRGLYLGPDDVQPRCFRIVEAVPILDGKFCLVAQRLEFIGEPAGTIEYRAVYYRKNDRGGKGWTFCNRPPSFAPAIMGTLGAVLTRWAKKDAPK